MATTNADLTVRSTSVVSSLWRNLLLLGLGALTAPGCGPEPQAPHLDTVDSASQAATMFAPELARGVDAAETQTYFTCVAYSAVGKEQLGFSSRYYDEYSVQTRQELDQKLSISAAASARGLWGSVSASGSYFRQLEMAEANFYWLVDAQYALEKERLNLATVSLTESAKQILRQRGIRGFYRACGTHFYTGRTLGARYMLIYEFKSRDDKFVENIEAAAQVSLRFGLDAEAQFSEAITQATRSSVLKIHSVIIGGGPDIADYATDPAVLKDELLRLRNDLAVNRQGVPLEWEIAAYDGFPEVQEAKANEPGADGPDLFRRDALAWYYTLFTANQDRLQHLNLLLQKSAGPEPAYYFSRDKLRTIAELTALLRAQNDEIGRRATQCLSDAAAACSTVDLAVVQEPEEPAPDRDLTEFEGWSIVPALREHGGAFVDLVGMHVSGATLYFDTGRRLLDSPVGAYVLARDVDGAYGSVSIGRFDPHGTAAGGSRPQLCIDQFASVCSFRVVEGLDAEGRLRTGRLVLRVFDDHGFEADKLVFHAR